MQLGNWSKGLAFAAVAVLSLAACSEQTTTDESASASAGVPDTAVTVAWNQPLYSFNQSTSSGNATANAVILYMTQSGFNYYDADQNLVDNTAFGTYELVSEDPMQVKYDINDGVTWSDGTPVDETDLLLNWAALSGYFNEGEAQYDEETGVLIPSDTQIFFDSVVIGTAISETELPTLGDDGSFTLNYTVPSIDWKLNFTGAGVPAHVVGQRALGIEDPLEAKQAVKDAILNEDHDALVKLSAVWSLDFDVTEMPAEEDLGLLVGNGAYAVSAFVADEYITLEAREDYVAGPAPSVGTITVKWIPDALASVQALQNGEISLTQPQATADLVEAANALGDGYTILNKPEATYEHLDLVFNSGGPFDPATYGGDAEKAKLVRQAFLMAIDVNEVIDTLIAPVQPGAEWNQSQVFLPGAPGYDASVAGNGSEVYGQGDIEGAKALLAEAGVTTPIDVRMLFSSTNTRRVNEYTIYADQVAEAGFTLLDASSEEWGSLLGSGTYDVSLFGWQSTSTSPLGGESIFVSDGGSNFTGYASETVDSLYDEISTTFDEDIQRELLAQVDAELYTDAYGLTVFQFPGVTVFDSGMTGVNPGPLSPTIFWNFWEWGAPTAK